MLHRNRRCARRLGLACLLAGSPAGLGLAQPVQPGPHLTLAAASAPIRPTAQTLAGRPGQTLAQLLATAGIGRREAQPVLDALAGHLPAQAALLAGQPVMLRRAPTDEALLALTLQPRPDRTVTVTRTPIGWVTQEARAGQRRHLVLARGAIRQNLLQDLAAAGLPLPLAGRLVTALAHDLDFQRDLRPGDQFAILFERFRDDAGGLLHEGRMLHASLTLAGRPLALWRYEAESGPDWFDEQGRSLRREFLRTPLEGARVSSGFGARAHPVLGFTRQHQGIDFAAPQGTPVLAAADGEVAQLGWLGGYGRVVELRHAGDRSTRYGHLASFAPGLKPGDRVRQGEVIGRVGRTGLATGPHLHYELLEAGRAMDPALAPGRPALVLAGAELALFQANRDGLARQVARLQPLQEVASAE